MTEPDLSRAVWHKSSYSGQNGACVEVSTSLPAVVGVRDSKDADGPKLIVQHSAWSAFVDEVRAGRGVRDGRAEA